MSSYPLTFEATCPSQSLSLQVLGDTSVPCIPGGSCIPEELR